MIATNALFNAPRGLFWVGGNTGLLVSDTENHRVRRVFVNTNYNTFSVETYVSSGLIRPVGLAMDIVGNFPIVDLGANQLLSIQVTAPQAPVMDPQIGIITLTTNVVGDLVTQLTPIVNATYNNDVLVAILGEEGVETFYTLIPTRIFPKIPPAAIRPCGMPTACRSGPIPLCIRFWTVRTSSSAPSAPRTDGDPVRLVNARFQFKVANPIINGKNPGNFTLSVNTDNAEIWYTTDGTAPTNRPPSDSVSAGQPPQCR